MWESTAVRRLFNEASLHVSDAHPLPLPVSFQEQIRRFKRANLTSDNMAPASSVKVTCEIIDTQQD